MRKTMGALAAAGALLAGALLAGIGAASPAPGKPLPGCSASTKTPP